MIDSAAQVKFKCSLSPNGSFLTDHTANQGIHYAIGSGASVLEDLIGRIRPPKEETPNPKMILSIVEDELYKHQFVAPQGLIFSYLAGGAIVGVYTDGNRIQWSEGRTVIPFVNIGGTGLDAEFRWLPMAYKTWMDDRCLYSSAVFEQDGAWYQRLTQYKNLISGREVLDENILPSQGRSMNSATNSVMLLPDSVGQHIAVIRVQGGTPPFDEEVSAGRLSAFRLNKTFFSDIGDMFFVRHDQTIALFRNAHQAKVEWSPRRYRVA